MGNLQTLDPAFANRLGPIDRFCNTYRPRPEVTVTTCETPRLDIVLTPGEVIRTTGGVTTVTGIDFGLQDRRITPLAFANPSRWESNSSGFDTFHVVPASDYFAEPYLRRSWRKYRARSRREAAPSHSTYRAPRRARGSSRAFRRILNRRIWV